MKQKNRYIATLIILLLGLSGCATDEDKVSGKGTIRIGVNLDTSVKTKAGENIQSPIKLTIVKSDKDGKPVPESPVYEYDLTTDGSREISLNVDTYILTAIVGKDPKGSPASEPYYVGTKIVTLTAGKTEKITMDCKLTTAVIVVDYSGLGDYGGVEDYQTIVENSTGNITFSKNSGTKGYFVAGKALSVTFRYKIGTTWTEKEMPEITTLVAQHQYTIKYTVKDDGSAGNTGSAGIGIEITSPSEKDVQIDITIPLDLSIKIIPDETSAEIIGSVKTNTGLKNASFEYKAKDDTEWTLVPLDSDLKAKISELKSGQLYNYKFTCAGNEKTGDFVTSPTVNPWATFALFTTASGNMDDLAGLSLKYKENIESVTDWEESSELKLSNLEPNKSYKYKFVSDGVERKEKTFETEEIMELPNMGFESWTMKKPFGGKDCWYPNTTTSATNTYWSCGNEGVTSLFVKKESITTRVEGFGGKGYAAKLVTIGGVTLVGYAAGNLFTGTYATNMLDPKSSVKFGQPYGNARPTRLSGYYKYISTKITNSDGIPSGLVDDLCDIYIWLKDSDGNEIAFGRFSNDNVMNDYVAFEIEIEYLEKFKSSKPKTIAIVATSSRYGGDFTGSKVTGAVGVGSTLFVDEFKLGYDDEPIFVDEFTNR